MKEILTQIILIPVARIQCMRATNKGCHRATQLKQVFNTALYHTGAAVEVQHYSGSKFNAIITDANNDYIQCIRIDKSGEHLNIEIELKDYLKGVWRIRKLL